MLFAAKICVVGSFRQCMRSKLVRPKRKGLSEGYVAIIRLPTWARNGNMFVTRILVGSLLNLALAI